MPSEYDALFEPPKQTSEYDALLTQPAPAVPDKTGRSLLESIGGILGKARDIGTEVLSEFSPEMSARLFGQTTSSLRPEQISQPLISPATASEIVGQLPDWAGGQTQFAKGAAEGISGAVSELSRPSSIGQLPAFAVPGVAETFAANVAAVVPRQIRSLKDIFQEHGILSKEAGAAVASAGIEDLMGLLAAKSGTAARFRAAEKLVNPKTAEGVTPQNEAQIQAEAKATETGPGAPSPVLMEPPASVLPAEPVSPEIQAPPKMVGGEPVAGTRVEGPALVDADGNVILRGKLGETHKDLLDRAMAGPDAEKALEAFMNDAQHTFVDDQGNVLDRKQAAELGVKAGQLPEGTTEVQSQSFKADQPAAPTLRPGEKQGDLLSTQTEDLKLVGEKGRDFAKEAADKAAADIAAEEARLKQEHEQSLLSDLQEHQERSGMELLDAINQGGGLPTIAAGEADVLSGELKNIQEAYKSGDRKEVINYSKIFKKGAPGLDKLTQYLRSKGFNVETPADTVALIEDRIKTGKPLYGNEATGTLAVETQGAIGPGAPTLSALPAQAVTRPIKSQRQIITDLAKGLNVPIRFGRLRTNKFAGYFLPKADLIGSKRANDLTTVTHEVGHKLDREFSFSGDKTIRSELDVLGDPATPGSFSSWTKSKPLKYKYGEGIAEFVRYWLTDPTKVAKEAPATHAAFEKILDANKDVGDVLRQAQEDIQVWRTSEAQTRLRSHISVGDNPNKTRYTLSQLTRDLVDDLHILRLASDDATRKLGRDLPPSRNPYLLARNLRGSYGMADTFVRNGVTDFKTRAVELGTSLQDALKPIAGRVNDFRDWIVAKRAQELRSHGRETGLLPDDINEVAKKFDGDKQFEAAFKAVKEWNANVLKYAVDSGLVSPEGATAMLEMNQDYVPFHRVFEVGAGESSSQQSMGTGSGLNAGKPGSLKRLHGSTRQIVDPIETMVKNAYAIITASEKAAINNAVADLARLPDMGKWVEQVAAPKEQVKVGIEKIREQLDDAGADTSNLPDDLALMFYRQSGQPAFGENTIRIVRNGKPEFYRLNSDLFDTFHALDLEDSGKLVRILASPAQLLRSGVVLEPSFAFANAIRDTFSAAVIGKYGAKPFETTARGLAAMIGDPKLVAEWAASGGKSSVEANYFDRAKLQDFVAEKISKYLTPAERAMIVAKSPLTALRFLTGISEEATRIGEYKIAFDKLRESGMPEGEARRLAAFEARDRQDFAKGGAKTKIIRHLAAFWNAGLQANVKLFQTFKERPVRTLMQGFAFVTIPKLLEQAVNWNDQDYWDRPQWERDLFFLIPAGKGEDGHTRFIRIPTPFEVGVLFGTLPGRMIQYAKEHNPKALTGYFNTLLQQSVPNPIPQGLQMVFEDFLSGKQGWDIYRGRPIVPDALADQPPELQFTEQTSALAKKVGGAIGYSPMKVDHIISQTMGGLGKVLSGQQIPGKRFVTTPLAVSNQATQDFYDKLESLRTQKKRVEAGSQTEYPVSTLKTFEHAARDLSDLRSRMRKAESEPEKNTLREELYQRVKQAMREE